MNTSHPLLEDGIRPIRNWDEFITLWNETKVAELRHSLLHFGFHLEVDQGQWVERILFYLKMADLSQSFVDYEERVYVPLFSSFGRDKGIESVRKAVARKAFDALCEHLFKNTKDNRSSLPSWFEEVSTPAIFHAILDFFQPSPLKFVNMPREQDRKSEIVRSFLLEFVRLGWREFDFDDRVPDATTKMFQSARPRLIMIIAGLERHDLLLKEEYSDLGKEEFDVLRKIAESYEFWDGPKKRKAVSVEEAAAFGSPTAQILILLRIRSNERNRLSKIRDLERRREQVEKELEKAKA